MVLPDLIKEVSPSEEKSVHYYSPVQPKQKKGNNMSTKHAPVSLTTSSLKGIIRHKTKVVKKVQKMG